MPKLEHLENVRKRWRYLLVTVTSPNYGSFWEVWAASNALGPILDLGAWLGYQTNTQLAVMDLQRGIVTNGRDEHPLPKTGLDWWRKNWRKQINKDWWETR